MAGSALRAVAALVVATGLMIDTSVDAVADGLTSPVELVSSTAEGEVVPNAGALPLAISGDGNLVVFRGRIGDGTFFPGQSSTSTQVILKERSSGALELISRTDSGRVADSPSNGADMTPDGRFVLFVSQDNRLDSEVSFTSTNRHVYLLDRQTGDTEAVDVSTSGEPSNRTSEAVAVSDDGRYVWFTSSATNLGAEVPTGILFWPAHYVRDRVTGETFEIEETNPNGPLAGATQPELGAATSDLEFLYLSDGTAAHSIYRLDWRSGSYEPVMVPLSTGQMVQAEGAITALTADDNELVFSSRREFVAGDRVNVEDVYVTNLSTSTIEIVSVDSDESLGRVNDVELNGGWDGSISGDGRYVAFISRAALASPDVFGPSPSHDDIYLRDRVAGETYLVSDGSPTISINQASRSPVLSPTANSIAFNVQPFGQAYARDLTDLTNPNHAPEVSIAAPDISVDEGSGASTSGVFADTDGDALAVTCLVCPNGALADEEDGSWTWTATPVDGPSSYTVTAQAVDPDGGVAEDSFDVVVDNVAPTINELVGPTGTTWVGSDASFHAAFSDPGVSDTHVAEWDWGDGTTSAGSITESAGAGTVDGNHEYTAAGSYQITITITDDDGDVDQSSVDLVVAPAEETVVLSATGDSYLRQGAADTNEGASPFLSVRSSGNNRSLVKFSPSALSATVGDGELLSAILELDIVENGENWGSGRTVDVHRVTSDWTEGVGNVADGHPADRGSGEGVTWNCAIDANIANQRSDCAGPTAWEMAKPEQDELHPWYVDPTDSVIVTNATSGTIGFDVTADVAEFLSGSANHGWLLRKTAEGAAGRLLLDSREGGGGPRLVLTFAH